VSASAYRRFGRREFRRGERRRIIERTDGAACAAGTLDDPPTMPRVIWKGAISFGLVHVPVALYPAAQSTGIDFDWLDRRSMDPVGYKRVNKRTGKEIGKADIVKGIRQDDGDYVVLSDAQIAEALPKSTQTIEIERFVHAGEIPFPLFETPYYLTPTGRAEKVYALLREAMHEAGVVGVARLVMHAKEHLAVLVANGPALMLNTVRWADELRDPAALEFPAEGRKAVKDAELKMARQLIEQMTQPFEHGQFSDHFTDAIHALVQQKLKAGDTEQVQPLETAPEASTNVVDLAALLKQSLTSRREPARAAPRKAAARKAPARAAAKSARRSA
jgi:DNA end-binding protein Ku